jgi:hypothetical protein
LLEALLIEAMELREEHPGCGVEKMHDTLRPAFLGRDRFIAIFMDFGFRLIKPKNYIKTTFSVYCRYKNLISGLLVTDINQVVQSDISYILIGANYYYLVFIIDVFSKLIVGYEVSDHLRAQANVKALKQVIRLRGAESIKGMIHHSDKGSQYVADEYTRLLISLNCHISMGNKAQENAYAERINGTIKNEYLQFWDIRNFTMLKRLLKKAVDHYNSKRKHDHLPQRLSPLEFESALKNGKLKNPHFELIYAKENFVKRKKLDLVMNDFEVQQTYFCPIFEYNFIN